MNTVRRIGQSIDAASLSAAAIRAENAPVLLELNPSERAFLSLLLHSNFLYKIPVLGSDGLATIHEIARRLDRIDEQSRPRTPMREPCVIPGTLKQIGSETLHARRVYVFDKSAERYTDQALLQYCEAALGGRVERGTELTRVTVYTD